MVVPILDSLRGDLTRAFRLREELINMKKVAYHVHHSGTLIERSLAQLATYFRTDHSDVKQDTEPHTASPPLSFFVHSDRFTAIVDARMRCKGACHASADARAMAKQVCCLPRHPLKKRPTILENLPSSLETSGLVRDTLQTLNSDDLFSEAVSIDDVGDLVCSTWKSKVEGLLVDLEERQAISQDVMEFIRLLIICRGADKAVRMVDEVSTAKAAVFFISEQIKTLLPVLTMREELLGDSIAESQLELNSVCPVADPNNHKNLTNRIASIIRKKIHYHRHFNLLTGSLPHLTELVAWLEKISSVVQSEGPQEVMFLASDSSAERHTLPAALQVPKVEVDTMALFAAYRAVESVFRPQMFHAIRNRGWPSTLQHALASSEQKEETVANNKHCQVCERSYSCLWVHRGVCCECEDRIRQSERRCPFRTACKSTWFCPHSLRCLVCDAHSCDACRLLRGDASVVSAVAGRIIPSRIAFDFDRTLASTKSGASPIIGKHTADVDLVSLMWKYSCVVVTRNQNKAAIKLFLAEQGAPPDVEVCLVGKKESKVKFVLGLTSEGGEATSESNTAGPIIFVDDSVQELVDPLVAKELSIYRVLFVRSLA